MGGYRIVAKTVYLLFLSIIVILVSSEYIAREPMYALYIHIPPIHRGDNGVADIYINLDSDVEKPWKIKLIPFLNDHSIQPLEFYDINMENNSIGTYTIHLHLYNLPKCDYVAVTLYFSSGSVTGRGIVINLPKPENPKAIDVNRYAQTGKIPDELSEGLFDKSNLVDDLKMVEEIN